MKQQSTMPTDGEFVAVWCYKDSIYNCEYFYENGKLYASVSCDECGYHKVECGSIVERKQYLESHNAVFITKD